MHKKLVSFEETPKSFKTYTIIQLKLEMLQKTHKFATLAQIWLKFGPKIHVNRLMHWYAKIMATRGYNGIMGCFERRRGAYLYSSKGIQLLSFSCDKLII